MTFRASRQESVSPVRCRISLHPSTFGGSERMDYEPQSIRLLSFLFFLFSFSRAHVILFPASFGNTYASVPYRALLDSPGSISFSLWNICCSSSRDDLCCFCPLSVSTWSRALGHQPCQSCNICPIFLIELLSRFKIGLQ